MHRRPVVRPVAGGLTIVAVALAAAAPAAADILVLTNGRTVSVRDHSVDGDRMTVTLRSGGVATFERDLVARIDPERIPDSPTLGDDGSTTALRPVPAPPDTTTPPTPFAALIDEVAGRYGVDARLVHAVVRAESNYQPRARSPKGARGLMQLLPSTAAAFGAANLYDPPTNLDAGVRYLKSLLSEFDLPEALAAYNAGPATVRRFGGVPPFPETRRYVGQVLAQLRP